MRVTNGITLFKGSESCIGHREHGSQGKLRFASVGGSGEGGGQKPGSLGTDQQRPSGLGAVGGAVCAEWAGRETQLSPLAAGDCHPLALALRRQGVYIAHL